MAFPAERRRINRKNCALHPSSNDAAAAIIAATSITEFCSMTGMTITRAAAKLVPNDPQLQPTDIYVSHELAARSKGLTLVVGVATCHA